MKRYQAIVLGLGGMGSAATWQLARRGVRVLGLEQFTSPHNRGSSHGRTRVIRQAYFEDPAYVPLLLRAYELWQEAEAASGRRLLTLCGGLMLGRPDSEVVRGSIHSAREHHLPHEILEAREIRRRFPQFNIHDDDIALFEARAGFVEAEAAVQAHLDLAARHGATLQFEEPVLRWEHSGDGVVVTTTRGTYAAESLVVSPGPWAPTLLEELGLPLQVERQVLYWFQPRNGIENYLPDRFPIYIWESPDGLQPYGFPATDGPHGGVKAAFFRIPHAQICTPDTVDRQLRPADEQAMRAILRRLLPGLEGELRQATTCLYTCTPDLHFVMGLHPAHAQVSFAAGFSGHGFKFCSVVGEILADLATHRSTHHDLSLFSGDRFAKRGGQARWTPTLDLRPKS